jgi:hypothetical protein
MRLVGKKILCRKCENQHAYGEDGSVLIYLPDNVIDPIMGMDWFKIVDVGAECELFTLDDVGTFVHCPPYAHGMHRLPDEYYIFDETLVGDGCSNTVIKPFVLLEA